MPQEMPKIEERGVKEALFEERLGDTLHRAIAAFLSRKLEQLDFVERKIPGSGAKEDFNSFIRVRVREAADRIQSEVRTGDMLLAIALFDTIASLREADEDIYAGRLELADGDEDPVEREGTEEARAKAMREKELYASYRDWLSEKTTDLNLLYTRDDFIQWAKGMTVRFGVTIKEKRRRKGDAGLRRMEFARDALRRAAESRERSEEEQAALRDVLNREFLRYRSLASDSVGDAILGREFDRAGLLGCEKKVAMLRQFRVNLEAHEW